MAAALSDLEAVRKRPAELLRTLIRFDTSNPPGNERECISYVETLLAEAGIESTLRARDPERPNLVARLPGRGTAPPLLLYGHVDVVPAEGQQWRHPPFEGVVEDGFVWGRGAVDMKGGVAMLLSAFLRAKASGLAPAGDVLLCLLSDEEGFGDFGAMYMVDEHPELFEGVRFAIGEFGGFTIHARGRRFYPVQVAEKQICTLRLVARGPAGHGAMPVRGGAVARLAKAIERVDRARLPLHVTPVVRKMIDALAAGLSPPASQVVRGVRWPVLSDLCIRLMAAGGHTLDPLLRNTVSPTVLRASKKLNVIPSEASALLDGRILPGFDPSDFIAELRDVVLDDVEIELVRHDPGPTEADMTMFEPLAAILRHLDPGCTPMPLLLAGVTDGRFFSKLGIQTYGFLPMKLPPNFDFWKTVHGTDERIPASAIDFGAEAVYRALERYGEHPVA